MTRTIVFTVALCLLPALSALAAEKPKTYDLILRGGTIYDGSGGKPFVGDVAVNGDRIVAVGRSARSATPGGRRRSTPAGSPSPPASSTC